MKKLILLLAVLLMAGVEADAKKWRAGHVVFIGLDGWGSYSQGLCSYPNMQELMNKGCYTWTKRTVNPSDSGPNWAAMFNGAPVEMSGVKSNECKPEMKAMATTEHGMYPTLFHELRSAYPDAEMGCIYEWGEIEKLICSKDFNYLNHPKNLEIGSTEVAETACRYLKEKRPAMLFIHIDQIDHAGHGDGHRTQGYYDCVQKVDALIGMIVQGTRDAGIYDDCIFVISSDHGGFETHHGGISTDEIETPFIICGKGIRHGGEFTEPMMQYDVTATVAEIYRLKRPSCWRGVVMDVF